MKIFSLATLLVAARASASSAPFEQPTHRLRGAPQAQAAGSARRLVQRSLTAEAAAGGCTARDSDTNGSYKPTSSSNSTDLLSAINTRDAATATADTATAATTLGNQALVQWADVKDSGTAPLKMWNQGNPTKVHVSNAYFNWDLDAPGIMCILVEAVKNDNGVYEYQLAESTGDSWYKSYGSFSPDNSNNKGDITSADGEVSFIKDAAGKVVGWEACYEEFAGCLDSIEVHANWRAYDSDGGDGWGTTSTGKKVQDRSVAMDLRVPCPGLTTQGRRGLQEEQTALDASCLALVGEDPCWSDTSCNVDVGGFCTFLRTEDCCSDFEYSSDCDSGRTCVRASVNDSTGTCNLLSTAATGESTTGGGGDTSGSTANTETRDNNVDLCITYCQGEDLNGQGFDDVCRTEGGFSTGSIATGLCVCNHEDSIKDDDTECESDYDAANTCLNNHVCKVGKCIPTYKTRGDGCTADFDTQLGCKANQCQPPEPVVDGEPQGRMVCTSVVAVSEGNPCPMGSFSEALQRRGACDKGDVCRGDGTCNTLNWYAKEEGHVCRESVGACDKDDMCSGNSHSCDFNTVPDVKHGDSDEVHVCRETCQSCGFDPEETCPGGTDYCPEDIFMYKTLPIYAGQHHDAGYAEYIATQKPLGPEVCVTLKLENGWQLTSVDENSQSIKMHMCPLEPPGSAPGQYPFKNLAQHYQAADGVTFCYPVGTEAAREQGLVPLENGGQLYVAVHLDVQLNGETETAWVKYGEMYEEEQQLAALATTQDSLFSSPTSQSTDIRFQAMIPQIFIKTNGSKPKTQVSGEKGKKGGGRRLGAQQGWGEYLKMKCCASAADDICPEIATLDTIG